MTASRLHIGTSGWNYRHWRDVFYPQGVRQADWLAYFAEYFTTAEINNSFYRIPRRETVARWSSQVPADFRFAVKLWRGITQYKKLKDCRPYLRTFFEIIDALPAAQRGPLLVQLPPQQGRDLPKLDAFLDDVQETPAAGGWRVAVEFRHDNWLSDELYRLLDRWKAALCLHDMQGRGAVDDPNGVDFVYVRRHGAPAPEGCYTEKQLADDAGRIRRWRKQGKTVFVYFNNDLGGHAVINARQLREMVGR